MKYHFAALEDNIPEGCLYRVKPLYILASFYYLKKLKEENLNKLFEFHQNLIRFKI